jgi:hypothetical protein
MSAEHSDSFFGIGQRDVPLLSCDDLVEDTVKKQYFRCLVWFLLLWLSPRCFGQVIRIRVTNSKTGRPLQMQPVLVGLHYSQGEKAPTKYDANLRLETDANGEAQFRLPEPPPANLVAQVRLTSEHWHCFCMVPITTKDLIQMGIVVQPSGRESTTSATNAKAEPGVILFLARPFSFLERLFYPLVKD